MTLKPKRWVKVEETGAIYKTVVEAAEAFGVDVSAIYKRLNGTRKGGAMSLTLSWVPAEDD